MTLKDALNILKEKKGFGYDKFHQYKTSEELYRYGVKKCIFENYEYFVTIKDYLSNNEIGEFFELRVNSLQGLVDFNGSEIFKPIYRHIVSFDGKNCIVFDNGLYRLLSKEGKELASGLRIVKDSLSKNYLITKGTTMIIDEDGNLIDKQE